MNFANPHFAEPAWLWLVLLGLVLLVLLHRYAAHARQKQLAKFALPGLLASLLSSHSPLRRAVKHLLLVLAVVLMGLALARPQWGEQAEVTQALGEDVIFILDCSRSMMAEDVRPTRLARAQLAIQDFVQRHGRGRVGLVAFAGQAFLQCPLTFDYDAFRDSMLAVDADSIPVPGTDIARALDESFLAMEKDHRRKFMVLVTDGEDLEKGGVAKAQSLAEKGVRLYTVGVGTAGGSLIQVPDGRGGVQPLRDERGQVVESRLDEVTLRALAAATGGDYQPLGALGEGMGEVRRALANATDAPGASLAHKFGVDRFHVFVAAVLALLVAESLIGTRRRVVEGEAVKP
ncbi:MAG: VWA domain-containing protein [Verrucomicrobia bacterium]|nr:VWA domain-containing protein [Verrucomicrobiota bacterium]